MADVAARADTPPRPTHIVLRRRPAEGPESEADRDLGVIMLALEERNEACKNIEVVLQIDRTNIALISQLPAEIICEIFQCLKATLEAYGSLTAWTTVTHVCRQWREIALDCPALWATLTDAIPPRWLEAMLIRSKTAPLSITFNHNPVTKPTPAVSVLAEALCETDRLREVSVSGGGLSKLLLPLKNPTPLLESVLIRVTPPSRIPQETSPLPEGFIQRVSPRLTHVDLYGWSPSFDSPVFSSLTRLRIDVGPDINYYFNTTPKGLVPEGDIFRAISRMPGLVELSLALPSPVIKQSPSRARIEPIRLAHLKALSIKTTCESCAQRGID
ncbi:hypothetical protein CC1G_10631 [Coprinopsis cinerea okayama7|uniref:F-box domain-containing protein n=1 Tax=Coprinopsis cinerea (strain Okayama-7 / 130 / ATCC MYA-4618 / FGSC 9003) TaxID=240176 RepID=A8P624_COPC7|nr:hypothetical protein CC1G_10631 [Coprinopsis cinerea okayama7\|eukprot:XP_001839066.2 hypothetical protein CC1G_10631 [Coprinopsis cinerea okayama7\